MGFAALHVQGHRARFPILELDICSFLCRPEKQDEHKFAVVFLIHVEQLTNVVRNTEAICRVEFLGSGKQEW